MKIKLIALSDDLFEDGQVFPSLKVTAGMELIVNTIVFVLIGCGSFMSYAIIYRKHCAPIDFEYAELPYDSTSYENSKKLSADKFNQ